MRKNRVLYILIIVSLSLLLSSCSNELSATEIIGNMRKSMENKELVYYRYTNETYFNEGNMNDEDKYDQGQVDNMEIYKGKDIFKMIVESDTYDYIILTDAKKIMTYYPEENILVDLDRDGEIEEVEDSDIEGDSEVKGTRHTIESITDGDFNIKENVEELYNIKSLGKEEIDGYNTYHLSLELIEKNEDYPFTYDIWVDDKEFNIVRTIIDDNIFKIITNLEEYNDKIVLTEDMFKLDYPEDVRIINSYSEW